MRFDEAASAATAVKFLTDGVLIREAMQDPALREYSHIILDEARGARARGGPEAGGAPRRAQRG